MHTVAFLDASIARPDQLNQIMADCLALEHAMVFRRLVWARCACLGGVAAAISIVWLPASAFWVSVGLCAAAVLSAWTVEVACRRRLARRLDALPQRTWTTLDATASILAVPTVRKS